MNDELYIELGDEGQPVLKSPNENPTPAPAAGGKTDSVPPAPATSTWRPDSQRRRDAIVDAARTLEDLSPDGVREFVTKRWQGRRVLEEADVKSFAADARQQRVNDVIDALDHRVRHGVYGRTKTAHVSFPRGMVRRTLRELTTDEGSLVVRRLRDRGWSDADLKRHLKTFGNEIKKATGVAASEDDWTDEIMRIDPDPLEELESRTAVEQGLSYSPEDLVAFAEKLAESMPAPQVTVEVKAPEATNKRIVRDDRGRISGVESA